MAEAPAVRAGFGGSGELTASSQLTMSVNAAPAALDDMEEFAPGGDLGELTARALAFYLAAAKAARAGKHVGVTSDADALETEFVGF